MAVTTKYSSKNLDVTDTVGHNEVLVDNGEENIGRLKLIMLIPV